MSGTLLYQGYKDASTGYELWKSDGTDAGTGMVKEIYPGPASGGPTGLVAVNGEAYFWATDSAHGMELWKSDGTDGGTSLIMDFIPGPFSSGYSPMTLVGSALFFSAFSPGGR